MYIRQQNFITPEVVHALSPLLDLLPMEERRMLERSAEVVEYKRHEPIYNEGDRCWRYFWDISSTLLS